MSNSITDGGVVDDSLGPLGVYKRPEGNEVNPILYPLLLNGGRDRVEVRGTGPLSLYLRLKNLSLLDVFRFLQ